MKRKMNGVMMIFKVVFCIIMGSGVISTGKASLPLGAAMTPKILYRDSIPQITTSSISRFWEKVDKTPGHGPHGECWVWTGCADKLGYGRLTLRPYRFLSSRFVWLLETGILDSELEILHECDYPPCVRPSHLHTGTHKENMGDCKKKGRHGYGHVYGELVGNHKLQAFQVREIRQMYGNTRKGYAEIAARYSVSGVLIGQILRGEIWKDDSDPKITPKPTNARRFGNVAKRTAIEQPADPYYRFIPLTQGQYAIVDVTDYKWLMQWSWYAKWCEDSGSFYAARNSRASEGKHHTIRMHSQIMGLAYGDKRTVDHIESEKTLDNRRSNLRIATDAEQNMNKSKFITNTTGFKGVTRVKGSNLYVSQIGSNGKKIHLALSEDPKVAYYAYCKAAKKYHGDFARTT